MGASIAVSNNLDPTLMKVVDTTVSKGSELFLKDKEAKAVFLKYVQKEDWKKKLGTSSNLLDQLGDTANIPPNIYSEFIFSTSQSKFALDLLTERDRRGNGEVAGVDIAKLKIKNLLLAAIFPLFLQSDEYNEFVERKAEQSKVAIELPIERSEDNTTRENRLDDLFAETVPLNTRDVVAEAAASVDEQELDALLSSGQWLGNLFASVENLSFCVSLASARADRPGFPLIYVNKAFEITTGYTREEIVGQNCQFLQSVWSEKDQIELMTKALATAQPVKVAITNTRKDGSGLYKHPHLAFCLTHS